MNIAIIADDLSGAADAAAPAVSREVSGIALLWNQLDAQMTFGGSLVVSISTETRDVPKDHLDLVENRTRNVTQFLLDRLPSSLMYKKIDSTLKGHISVEVGAILSQTTGRTALISPALPSQGRTVRNGEVLVNGNKVESLEAVLKPGIPRALKLVSLSVVRSGADALENHLATVSSGDSVAFCVDAETEEDLRTIADVIVKRPQSWLPVGSSGLLRAISASANGTESSHAALQAAIGRLRTHPVLVIAGSRQDVTRKQLNTLARAANTNCFYSAAGAMRQFQFGLRVAITATQEADQDQLESLKNLLVGTERLQYGLPMTVVVTGGATASALLERWSNVVCLELLGEVEPGVVLAEIITEKNISPVQLVIKAGGFGTDQTLLRCAGIVE